MASNALCYKMQHGMLKYCMLAAPVASNDLDSISCYMQGSTLRESLIFMQAYRTMFHDESVPNVSSNPSNPLSSS